MSYSFNFHNYLGSCEAVGDFDIYEVQTAGAPHFLFHQGQTMYLEFNWKQSGINHDPSNKPPYTSWALRVFFELMGPGETTFAPSIPSQAYVAGDPHTYDPARFSIGTGSLAPGIYRVTAALLLMIGTTPYPFAGFTEGPMIQIFA